MAVDITNHLIPYTQVKRMLAKAWDEGAKAEGDYRDSIWDWQERISDYNPEPPPNPYRDET